MENKKESSLIGFDPLSWMDDDKDKSNASDYQNSSIDETSSEQMHNQKNIVNHIQANNFVEFKSESELVSESEIPRMTEPENEIVLTLKPTHNIQNVSILYEQLLQMLESQQKIEIDASAVVLIDATTLQLLIVLKRSAAKLHKEVLIDFPSERFIEAASLLGLSEMLEVDNAAAGLF